MAYLKINGTDFSAYVNELKVHRNANYTAQTNAAGNTVVDYINHKRTFEVGIIPVDDEAMKALQSVLTNLQVRLSYRDTLTGALVENVQCILPSNNIEYYTIQSDKVMYKAFTLQFIEL
jgi:hypothetical protein